MKIPTAEFPRSKAIGRRNFIKLGAAVVAIPTLTRSVLFGFRDSPPDSKCLTLYNTHTGESLSAAAGSLHMSGQAIDIRVPGCRLFDLRRTALSLKAGGVGYYPKPDFVHVDIGRVRCW